MIGLSKSTEKNKVELGSFVIVSLHWGSLGSFWFIHFG